MTKNMANLVYRSIKENNLQATKEQIKNMYDSVNEGWCSNVYSNSISGTNWEKDSMIVDYLINGEFERAQSIFNDRF